MTTHYYLRQLFRLLCTPDSLIEDFSASHWNPEWLECLEEAARTLIRSLTHHVQCLLKTNYVCLNVKVWSHLEQVEHG